MRDVEKKILGLANPSPDPVTVPVKDSIEGRVINELRGTAPNRGPKRAICKLKTI